MTEQEKKPHQPIPEVENSEKNHEGRQPEQHDRLKETTEKIWDSTRHAWSTATFKANQYKKLVQKKIDQSSLHKKIHAAHTDLGKMIDDLREAGKKNILNLAEVKEILSRIDELKAEAVTLEEEIEQIRGEELSEEKPQEEPGEEEKTE